MDSRSGKGRRRWKVAAATAIIVLALLLVASPVAAISLRSIVNTILKYLFIDWLVYVEQWIVKTITEILMVPVIIFVQINPCVWAPSGHCPSYFIDTPLTDTPLEFQMPQDTIINTFNVRLMEMFQMFYIAGITLCGIYMIFMNGSPHGRAQAKDTFTRLIVGMVLVAIAPIIFQMLLDIVNNINHELIKDAASNIKDLDAFDTTFSALKYCCTMWFFMFVLAIAGMVCAIRYFLVFTMACFFPLTLFFYFTDIPNPLFSTRGFGTRMLRFTILVFIVQIIQVLCLSIGLILLRTPSTGYDFRNFLLMIAAFVGVLAAPLLGLQLMAWVGTVIQLQSARPATTMSRFIGSWMRTGSISNALQASSGSFMISHNMGDHVGGATSVPGGGGQSPAGAPMRGMISLGAEVPMSYPKGEDVGPGGMGAGYTMGATGRGAGPMGSAGSAPSRMSQSGEGLQPWAGAGLGGALREANQRGATTGAGGSGGSGGAGGSSGAGAGGDEGGSGGSALGQMGGTAGAGSSLYSGGGGGAASADTEGGGSGSQPAGGGGGGTTMGSSAPIGIDASSDDGASGGAQQATSTSGQSMSQSRAQSPSLGGGGVSSTGHMQTGNPPSTKQPGQDIEEINSGIPGMSQAAAEAGTPSGEQDEQTGSSAGGQKMPGIGGAGRTQSSQSGGATIGGGGPQAAARKGTPQGQQEAESESSQPGTGTAAKPGGIPSSQQQGESVAQAGQAVSSQQRTGESAATSEAAQKAPLAGAPQAGAAMEAPTMARRQAEAKIEQDRKKALDKQEQESIEAWKKQEMDNAKFAQQLEAGYQKLVQSEQKTPAASRAKEFDEKLNTMHESGQLKEPATARGRILGWAAGKVNRKQGAAGQGPPNPDSTVEDIFKADFAMPKLQAAETAPKTTGETPDRYIQRTTAQTAAPAAAQPTMTTRTATQTPANAPAAGTRTGNTIGGAKATVGEADNASQQAWDRQRRDSRQAWMRQEQESDREWQKADAMKQRSAAKIEAGYQKPSAAEAAPSPEKTEPPATHDPAEESRRIREESAKKAATRGLADMQRGAEEKRMQREETETSRKEAEQRRIDEEEKQRQTAAPEQEDEMSDAEETPQSPAKTPAKGETLTGREKTPENPRKDGARLKGKRIPKAKARKGEDDKDE